MRLVMGNHLQANDFLIATKAQRHEGKSFAFVFSAYRQVGK